MARIFFQVRLHRIVSNVAAAPLVIGLNLPQDLHSCLV